MRIRTKILLSHLALTLTVTLVCLAIVTGLMITKDDRRQLQTSHEQLRNINLVAADANRLSEQIAELFILGGQDAEIMGARDTLLARLDYHRRLIEHEHVLAGQPGASWGGLDRIANMERLVAEIDRSREALQAHLAAGRQAEAERIYGEELEQRLDRALGELIEEATARERAEVAEALASSAELSQQSVALAIGLAVIVAALGLGNVIMLNRTILRPIADLAAGADAVGQGDLGHVVGAKRRDELGNLAARFNQMTSQLREQRNSLLRAKATLSDEVEARTQELRERTEELEALNAWLRTVDASRVQFFADISHELRTPLTVLRGHAEVALRPQDPEPAELRGALQAVVRKADQMGRLVDDLLFLARSEAGTIGVGREPVVLQEVISDVLLDGRGLPRRDGVRILPHQPAEPVVVRGDGDRLGQAVLIALDNAIKLAPAGTTVSVDLRCAGGRAIIRVSDEGPGFAEEELGAAFTRFHRGRPSRPRSGRGLGIGLSIAKWIIDQHEGSILIHSVPHGGATVEFSIPLAVEAAA